MKDRDTLLETIRFYTERFYSTGDKIYAERANELLTLLSENGKEDSTNHPNSI